MQVLCCRPENGTHKEYKVALLVHCEPFVHISTYVAGTKTNSPVCDQAHEIQNGKKNVNASYFLIILIQKKLH